MSDAQNISEFSLGEAVLELRWRLAYGTLLLKNRHLRSLRALDLPDGLLSWAHQHIEWTLPEGSAYDPMGVLRLRIDDEFHAQMDIVAYEELQDTSLASLIKRVEKPNPLAPKTIKAELLWAYANDEVLIPAEKDEVLSGANSLATDLFKTLKMPLSFKKAIDYELCDEVFLVSDEFGFVSASDKSGALSEQLSERWEKLIRSARE
ncbi:MAG: hypothetical protein Q4E22_03360 [Coriobacteriia bacterium]|nr:hypothetical protein [Coriobacteriia bacterium]